MRAVSLLATSSMSRVRDDSSTSAKIGFAELYITAWAVDTKVMAGTITSSPGPIPRSRMAISRAAVHDDRPTTRGAPTYAANSFSKASVRGPVPIHPDLRTSATAASSSSSMLGLNN